MNSTYVGLSGYPIHVARHAAHEAAPEALALKSRDGYAGYIEDLRGCWETHSVHPVVLFEIEGLARRDREGELLRIPRESTQEGLYYRSRECAAVAHKACICSY